MRVSLHWEHDESKFAEVDLTEAAGYGLRGGDGVRFPAVLDNARLLVSSKRFDFGAEAYRFQPELALYVYRARTP